MRLKFGILLLIAVLGVGNSSAQYFDDIYYDASKETKNTKEIKEVEEEINTDTQAPEYDKSAEYQVSYGNTDIQRGDNNNVGYDPTYVSASHNNSGYYTNEPEIVNGRDVDEYNRRYSYDDEYTTDYDYEPVDTLSYIASAQEQSSADEYEYTNRIRTFYNPTVIIETTDTYADAVALGYMLGTLSPSYYSYWRYGYYHPTWSWHYGWDWDPWFGTYWSWGPWYSHSWYSCWHYPTWTWYGHYHPGHWYGHHHPGYMPGGHHPGHNNHGYVSNGTGRRPFGNSGNRAIAGRNGNINHRPGYATRDDDSPKRTLSSRNNVKRSDGNKSSRNGNRRSTISNRQRNSSTNSNAVNRDSYNSNNRSNRIYNRDNNNSSFRNSNNFGGGSRNSGGFSGGSSSRGSNGGGSSRGGRR